MNTKLTLKLQQAIIEEAKQYAKKHGTSLSKLIENHLKSLTAHPDTEENITPLVKSLSGIITFPQGSDSKKDYSEYLANKYK